MRIKMIVTDLDGTLLRTDKTISDYTKAIFNQCRNLGIKVAYATARGESAEHLVPNSLVDGKIRMNGAIATIGDKVIYHCPIPHHLARPLLMACDERGMKITAESSAHYVNEHMYSAHDNKHQKLVDFSRHQIDSEKIYMEGLTPEDEVFITKHLPDNLYFLMAREGNGFGMIMQKGATKAKAASALASFWGIKQSEILAFGDDLNDIDLLRFAGVSVAMSNALDKVKGAAKQICLSNDDDGVAKWLEKHVL